MEETEGLPYTLARVAHASRLYCSSLEAVMDILLAPLFCVLLHI